MTSHPLQKRLPHNFCLCRSSILNYSCDIYSYLYFIRSHQPAVTVWVIVSLLCMSIILFSSSDHNALIWQGPAGTDGVPGLPGRPGRTGPPGSTGQRVTKFRKRENLMLIWLRCISFIFWFWKWHFFSGLSRHPRWDGKIKMTNKIRVKNWIKCQII